MATAADVLVLRARQALQRMEHTTQVMALETARFGEWRMDHSAEHNTLDAELESILDRLAAEVSK